MAVSTELLGVCVLSNPYGNKFHRDVYRYRGGRDVLYVKDRNANVA